MIKLDEITNLTKLAYAAIEEGGLNEKVIEKMKPIFGEPISMELNYNPEETVKLPYISFKNYEIIHDNDCCESTLHKCNSIILCKFNDEETPIECRSWYHNSEFTMIIPTTAGSNTIIDMLMEYNLDESMMNN